MAEAHPVGYRWVMRARERGAKIIHVDPRFGRTGATADTHVPIRAGTVPRDETLQDPRCVFQILRRHYARYTPDMVADICGISQEQFLEVAQALIDNSGRERTTALCYAVGWTQHANGVQIIRAGA